MKRTLLTLLAALVLGTSYDSGTHNDTRSHYDRQAHYDGGTHYDAPGVAAEVTYGASPLNSNGITSKADVPSTVAEPTFAWYGWDKLNIDGSTETLSEAGDPAAQDTPFCPDGDFSDITDSGDPASVSCITAQRFDGSADDFTGADILNLDNDISFCALARPSVINNTIAGRVHTDGDGYVLATEGNGFPELRAEVGASFSETLVATDIIKQWAFICVTMDIDGNAIVYLNGVAGSAVAMPAGNKFSATGFAIGQDAGGTYPNANADIAFVLAWDGTILTPQEVKDMSWHVMGLTPTTGGGVNTYTNAGASAQLVDAHIEEFSAGWAKIGGHSATRPDGAETPGGYIPIVSLTNRLPYTLDLTNWTANGGAGVVTCGVTSPKLYRDRNICTVEDDDGAGAEYVHTTLDMTSLVTGDRVTLTVAGRTASAQQGLDVIMTEQTTCGTPVVHNFTAQSIISTEWHVFFYTFLVSDGDCTDLLIQVCPVDFGADCATTSETSIAYVAPLGLVWGASGVAAPAISPNAFSAETNGATAAYGDDVLIYDISAPPLDSSGNIVKTTTLSLDLLTGGIAGFASSATMLNLSDGSSALSELTFLGNEVVRMVDSGGLSNSKSSVVFVWGTNTIFDAEFNYSSDNYDLIQDNTSLVTASTALTSPTALDELAVGCDEAGAAQVAEGFWVQNVEVRRK